MSKLASFQKPKLIGLKHIRERVWARTCQWWYYLAANPKHYHYMQGIPWQKYVITGKYELKHQVVFKTDEIQDNMTNRVIALRTIIHLAAFFTGAALLLIGIPNVNDPDPADPIKIGLGIVLILSTLASLLLFRGITRGDDQHVLVGPNLTKLTITPLVWLLAASYEIWCSFRITNIEDHIFTVERETVSAQKAIMQYLNEDRKLREQIADTLNEVYAQSTNYSQYALQEEMKRQERSLKLNYNIVEGRIVALSKVLVAVNGVAERLDSRLLFLKHVEKVDLKIKALSQENVKRQYELQLVADQLHVDAEHVGMLSELSNLLQQTTDLHRMTQLDQTLLLAAEDTRHVLNQFTTLISESHDSNH